MLKPNHLLYTATVAFLETTLPLEVVSCGVPFLFIPV